MAADGTTVVRIYNFDPFTFQIGPMAIYISQSADFDTPSTDYSSVLPLGSLVLNPVTFSEYVNAFTVLQSDIPPGLEYIEIEFLPLLAGSPDPIDPFAPPIGVNVFIENYYGAGVVEIGAYVGGGLYAPMGSREFSIDDNFGVYAIDLTAAVVPERPPFWTGFVQCVEIRESEPVPPGLNDGYFVSDAGTYNPDGGPDFGDGPVGQWEVPPGTTFTAIEPGKLELDTYGGIGSLVAIIDSNGGVGSNYGDLTWSGTFTFETSGTISGLDNGSFNHLERSYGGSDGAWVGATIDTAPGYPSDTVLYFSMFLNVQS